MGIKQVTERVQAKLALASIEEDIVATKRIIAASEPGSEYEATGLALLDFQETSRDRVAKLLEPEAPAPPKA